MNQRNRIEEPLIQINRLTVGHANRVLLEHVDLEVPRNGVMGLMGPSGTGKSTLLRTMGRWNDGDPIFWAKGSIYLNGRDVLQDKNSERVQQELKLLPQKARLFTGTVLENLIDGSSNDPAWNRQQRIDEGCGILQSLDLLDEFEPLFDHPVLSLSIGRHKMLLLARMAADNPKAVFIDEPLRQVAVVEETELIDMVRKIGRRIPVVLVTHSKKLAGSICDTICLVTGGRVAEVTPSKEFFTQPRTELGREFLLSGSAWPSSATPLPPILNRRRSRVHVQKSNTAPPRGFHWVLRGLMGGMEYPGLQRKTAQDLIAIRRMGVKHLVNLTEKPFQGGDLAAYGIIGEFFPIDDMGVPTLEGAADLCWRVSEWVDQESTIVFHCKAGLGRTGMLLACVLVYRGSSAINAIDKVRMTHSGYIQSDAQFNFIDEFHRYLAASGDRQSGLASPRATSCG